MNVAAALALFASFAGAQTTPSLTGPALTQLEQSADGPERAAAVADGSKPKTGPDGTAVVSERKNVYLGKRTVPPQTDCDGLDMGVDSPGLRHHMGRCTRVPGWKEKVWGDVETVKIVDRDAYVRKNERTGALIGMGVGALGFLALFAGPIGWFVGIGTVIVGALVGMMIGGAIGRGKPETFERTKNERSERE